MTRARTSAIAAALVAAGLAAVPLYQRWLRPQWRDWGATPDEVAQPLPGDDLIPASDLQGATTRAISIDAPPSAVWPWLAQMGQGRAGAYTYDWIENLFGLGMHSADHIIPELQHPQIGDVLLRTPSTEMRVQAIEPERALVTAAANGTWTWTFVLTPIDGGRTRLISRNRIRAQGPRLAGQLYMLVMEPASLVMERKMLKGIKERAERAKPGRGP